MSESVYLRNARQSECLVLTDLAFRSKAFWDYSPEFMAACAAELSVSEADITNPRCHYVVAEQSGDIIGFYALEQLSADEYELEALFVEPHHIGQGVGRKLIEHAKEQARRNGARALLIQGDPNAAAFYQAAGGVQTGERESESIPGRYLPEFKILLAE